MGKYKGKYKKCRSCQHAKEVHMVLVEVKETCPNGRKRSSMTCVDKRTCESCQYYPEGGCTDGGDADNTRKTSTGS